jgi:hypothetical protein
MKWLINRITWLLSTFKYKCPVEGCKFRIASSDPYLYDRVVTAHERHEKRKKETR